MRGGWDGGEYESGKEQEPMKVKDLVAKLKTFDPEQDVLCYCEDEEGLPEGHGFRLFDINGVDVTEAEKVRLDDGTPYLKLGKTPQSRRQVLIDITSDF